MNSPSTFTLAQAKESSIKNIIGVCTSSPEFVDLINEATERLMSYGDWFATVVKARFCVYKNCITWPRWVGTPLAISVCNNVRPIQNGWYEFMPVSASDCMNTTRWNASTVAVEDGLVPVFQNIPCGSTNYVRVYTRLQTDADGEKNIHIFGIDGNGQEYMTKDSNGDWQQGEVLTLAIPYVQTSQPLREVTKVIKSTTVGPIDLFQYDSAQDLLLDMAHYEHDETVPSYRHTTLRGGQCCANTYNLCSSGSSTKQITVLVKLQFIPVAVDTDTIQIQNKAALKLMIQAIRLEEAGADDDANKKQAMAIKELNRELRNKLPLDQIPIDVRACGTALPRLHGIGMIQ